MRRRTNGNEVARKVQAVLRQEGTDSGKSLAQIDVLHVPHIQMDNPRGPGLCVHPHARDGPRHHIARGEF